MERTEDLVPVPVLSLPDELSLLARALSRTLPMQILNQLLKKPMSAGELASELELRLSTLKYNLDVLERAGLVQVRQVRWSCKGREVKIYALAERSVLLVPRKSMHGDLFVLDIMEETLEHCRTGFQVKTINLPEGSGKNNSEKNNSRIKDKQVSSDKKHND